MLQHLNKKRGHSLLEAVIAAGIFVMVAIAFAGVWSMYGKAVAKSEEYLAANHLARSYVEGLAANGYSWLEDKVKSGSNTGQGDFTVVRRVRTRKADIKYHIKYELLLNTDPNLGNNDSGDRPIAKYQTEDLCMIRVAVFWRSGVGNNAPDAAGDFDHKVDYLTFIYKNGMK